MMGRRRKRNRNHFLQKDNLIYNSERNEENKYPVPHPNKAKINDSKETSDAPINTLKDEILQVITKNFMEKIVDMVNQNVQDALKKVQDTKNKEYEKTQKQIHELMGALN
jgi:hypothetical protein